jgi:hypothetical protein
MVALLGGLAAPARAATDAEVDKAIAKGREYLYGRMNAKTGNWEESEKADLKKGWNDVKGKQWGGPSAIAVYAILASGENWQSPRLAPGLRFVMNANIVGNYALGLRAQIWPFIPEGKRPMALVEKDRAQLERGVYTLRNIKDKQKDQEKVGFYAYWTEMAKGPMDNWYDRSVSQYGVLGMWACEQAGAEVPATYWQLIDAAWRNAQLKQGEDAGAWNYNSSQPKAKATMTAAGIATLYISQDYLLQQSNRWDLCRGGQIDANLNSGLAWMDKHIGELLGGNYYGMYGVERIGVASGRKYFGTTDWYAVGADFLVKNQKPDGSWGSKLEDTCFAMLFLSRGRGPVVMNKLEYEPNDPRLKKIPQPWNQRPRDVANFAHWSGRQTEHFLNWQVVNLKVSPDDLHDAPILYISGSISLELDDASIDKLREYVEDGGLVLANADCASPLFARSITNPGGLGSKLFKKYEFRRLPEDHVIFTDEQFHRSKWKAKPEVLSMSNGVRELFMVIPEADAGRAWQTRSDQSKLELFQLTQNIFLYTISKSELRFRGESYIVKPDPKAKPTGTLKVARLDVGENPNPEPGGWRRLAVILRNENQLALTADMVKLAPGALKDAKVAHLTGTTKFKLAPEQQKELKDFVARGGTLVVDAAGGSVEFAKAAEAELAATFGGKPGELGEILPEEHPLYNWPGAKIERFDYRNYVKGHMSGKLNEPRLRGITQNGRVAVFYSREDLSAGLVGQPVDGIIGYTPATATAIMRNILLYAAAGGKAPPAAAKPGTKPRTAPAKGASGTAGGKSGGTPGNKASTAFPDAGK